MATASSQLSESGLIAKAPFSGRHAYWACPPPPMPVDATTRSPLLNLFTSLPARSTSPANSVPRMRSFQGFPTPNMSFAIGRMDLVTNVKLRTLQSPVDTVVACIAIRTSLSLGTGFSTSLNWRRSGGPYWVCKIAFISVSFGVVVLNGLASSRAFRWRVEDYPVSYGALKQLILAAILGH